MTKRYWRAICDVCGATGKSSEERRWLDPFFCPDRCPDCGDYKSQYAYYGEQSGWTVSYGHWQPNPRPVPFRWLAPSTWFVPSSSTWIDFDKAQEEAGK